MYGMKSFQNLSNNVGNYALWYCFSIEFNEIIERAVIHVLYEHKESLFKIIAKIIPYDVPRLAQGHYCDFFFQFVKNHLMLNEDDSYSIIFQWVLVANCLVHSTHASFS